MQRIIIVSSNCPGTGLTTFGENSVDHLGKQNVYLLNFSDYLGSRPKELPIKKEFDRCSALREKVSDDFIVPHIQGSLGKFLLSRREPVLFLVGIPRTVRQAATLLIALRSNSKVRIDHVFFDLSVDDCRKRMQKRGRPDDTSQLIEKGIQEFGIDMVPTNSTLVQSCDEKFTFSAKGLISNFPDVLRELKLDTAAFKV